MLRFSTQVYFLLEKLNLVGIVKEFKIENPKSFQMRQEKPPKKLRLTEINITKNQFLMKSILIFG